MRRKFLFPGSALDKRMEPSDLLRFIGFVRVDENGCWIWDGAKDKKGYGSFKWNGKRYWATRIAYVNFRCALRPGNDVHHTKKCKSHSCVNPAHLLQKSREWNSIDGGKRRHETKELVPF